MLVSLALFIWLLVTILDLHPGFIDAEHMRELLETKGTPFRPKEMENFLSRAKDMETGNIYYEDYVAVLTQETEDHMCK